MKILIKIKLLLKNILSWLYRGKFISSLRRKLAKKLSDHNQPKDMQSYPPISLDDDEKVVTTSMSEISEKDKLLCKLSAENIDNQQMTKLEPSSVREDTESEEVFEEPSPGDLNRDAPLFTETKPLTDGSIKEESEPSFLSDEILVTDTQNNSFLQINEEEQEFLEDYPGLVVENKEISPTFPKTTKLSLEPRYFSSFHNQRRSSPELSENEVDKFWRNLEEESLDMLYTWPLQKIENYFFVAFQRVELIGELPISRETFTKLSKYIRRIAKKGGKADPRIIPPALFVTLMVFCARYSETDARNFWEPYSQLVWGESIASQYFQNMCREHFKWCRRYLEKALSIGFNYRTEGGVVRPVYQHAIIPYYLQDDFAEWLMKNFEILLQFQVEDLPDLLKEEKSLDYVPDQLRYFIRTEDTEATAARLIKQMAKAVKLFQDTEQAEAVESVMTSSIEKALWRAVYNELNEEQSHLEMIRKYTPKLEWAWNIEESEIYLRLAGVKTSQAEKPDSLYVIEKGTHNFRNSTCSIRVYPWRLQNGDWEVETIFIPSEKVTLHSRLLIFSEEYDSHKSPEEQPEHVIFEKEIPPFNKSSMFFQVSPNRKIARLKDRIGAEGEWIIITDKEFNLTNQSGNTISCLELDLPYLMREVGFTYAKRYKVEFPIILQMGQEKSFLDHDTSELFLFPQIEGNQKIGGLSNTVQPIFQSQIINFRFNLDQKESLRHIWLSIYRGGNFIKSVSLLEMEKQGQLKQEGNTSVISLQPFISQSGVYSINLLRNLQPLLNEPIQFAYLSDVNISTPDVDVCYSPAKPLKISIAGVSKEQIITYQDETVKITGKEDEFDLQWRILKNPQCRFSLHCEGSNIQFCWEIQRVTAWIEGGSDKNIVKERQEKEVTLQVRGGPNSPFSWIIKDADTRRRIKLDAKGLYERLLSESVLRDMLRDTRNAKSIVEVEISGEKWEVFQYHKSPEINIISVLYQDSILILSLTVPVPGKHKGSYRLQAINKDLQIPPTLLKELEELKNVLELNIPLAPGEYIIEILLNDERVATSEPLIVLDKSKKAGVQAKALPLVGKNFSPEELFCGLTSGYNILFEQDQSSESYISPIRQLILIHTLSVWITNDAWENGLKRLLPSWAVLNHPLSFTTIKHARVLDVFPERLAFGGKVGRGYTQIKLENKTIPVYVAWRLELGTDLSKMWLMVPDLKDVGEISKDIKFSELPEKELNAFWPAYQCIDCGEIVGSRDGHYLELPPFIVSQHSHGKQRKRDEQFVDTVYPKESIEISITQNKKDKKGNELILRHAYSSKDVVVKDYLHLLGHERVRSINGDLNTPIGLFDNRDYCCAVTELHKNYQNKIKQNYIKQFIGNSKKLKLIEDYFDDHGEQTPAFMAMGRLKENLSSSNQLNCLPKFSLLLSMVLRLKANQLPIYNDLLSNTGVTEDDLIEWANWTMHACPKLLEWSIAWSELFYFHAIS